MLTGRFSSIAAGFYATCGVKEDATLVCWGSYNTNAPSGSFIGVATARLQSCGIRVNGRVECWGEVVRPAQD